jgi:arabinogalactan oligomer/maltooligosaccharide transport system substrate-binding protein
MKKKSCILWALLLLALPLGQCNPASEIPPTDEATPTQPAEEPTAAQALPQTYITLWHDWPDSRTAIYQEIIDEFNATLTPIQVELVKVEERADALDVALDAGEGPDILQWDATEIGTQAQARIIVPLDPYLTTGYLEKFEPAAAAAMHWNEGSWGLPESQEGIALIYNQTLLEPNDLPEPRDFDALLEKAQDYRNAHPDRYYLCNPGLGNADAYHVAPIYLGHDLRAMGGYVDETGAAHLNTEPAYTAAQWITDFSRVAPAEVNPRICQAMFLEGQVPIWWTGPRATLALEDAEIAYGVAPMGSPYVHVSLFMLTRYAALSGHAPAAMDVMRYLTSAEVQKRVTLATRTVPANSAALQSEEIQALPIVAGFGEALHYGTPMPNHQFGACQWGPVADATLRIWKGKQTPTDALEEAQTIIEACIDDLPPTSISTPPPNSE